MSDPAKERFEALKEQKRSERIDRRIVGDTRFRVAKAIQSEHRKKTGKEISMRDALILADNEINPPPKPGDIIEQGGRRYVIGKDGSRRRLKE